jgi:2,4-dienoyl-CoA reductase-like NADH-dependent reductase (Old Yellow Enzyme family)
VLTRHVTEPDSTTPLLATPFTVRGVTLPNRIVVSPMCQYSSTDGLPNAWHLVHLGSRAVGGAGLVLTEAAAVSPEGRITPQDAGIWNDDQVQAWKPVVEFVRAQGSVAGVQLAHAGFKASTHRPWDTEHGALPASEGGWPVVGPTEDPFSSSYPVPRQLDEVGISRVVDDFAAAARRALEAGFQVVEVHAAHGYLLHEFLSPLSNTRTDAWGGSRENRMRLVLEVTRAVREAVGEDVPVLVRISATDWTEGGWNGEDSVALAAELKAAGADLVDCSTGGVVPRAEIPVGPGYQVPFAEQVRTQTGLPTGAVGMITGAAQAEAVLQEGQADVVLLARELLRDPYWPNRAIAELQGAAPWPAQYERAF